MLDLVSNSKNGTDMQEEVLLRCGLLSHWLVLTVSSAIIQPKKIKRTHRTGSKSTSTAGFAGNTLPIKKPSSRENRNG